MVSNEIWFPNVQKLEKKQPKMKVSNKQIGSPPEECFMHIAILHVGSVPVSLCPPTPQGPRVPPPSLVNRSTTAYTPHYRLTRASPYTGARTPGWATPLVTPVLGYSTVLYCTVLGWAPACTSGRRPSPASGAETFPVRELLEDPLPPRSRNYGLHTDNTFYFHGIINPCIKFLIFADWVLKTEQSVIGDSLSYLDMMERTNMEESRRARERQIMEEGLWVSAITLWTVLSEAVDEISRKLFTIFGESPTSRV